MRLEDVDTPALILDLDAFEANLKRLAEAVGRRVRVRAHAKTHKCPEIGKRQVAAGAVGLCCQKVSEAEAMVDGGIGDVLVSNEIVGARNSASAWTTRTTCANCRPRCKRPQRASTSTSSSRSACTAAASRRASRQWRWRAR